MSHEHPYGEPRSVLKFSKDDKVLIGMSALEKMLKHHQVRDRKISAFSIIGAYRKGKSFFLDYCLRFLYGTYPSINYPDNPGQDPKKWMGDEDEPLKGYSWRSGADRDTMGIVVWNDVFLHTDETTGEKIAIIVIDTQGLFDNETTTANNSRIFTLGTLISSIQVLNLSNVIQEDQLQYLQFATEFAKFASKNSQGSPEKSFQNLMFIIRDWQNPSEHKFGIEGGYEYLEKMLKTRTNVSKELRSVREYIKNSFDKLSCALLPHPGKAVTIGKVSSNEAYRGNWGDMDDDFRLELFEIIPYLLSPERLVVKKVNGIHINGVEYLEYVEKYFKLFQSDRIPHARAVFDTTVETHFNTIINACLDKYAFLIYENSGNVEKITDIPLIHERFKNEAILIFSDAKKMGNADHQAKFRAILEERINKIYNEWKEQTEANIRKVENEKKKTRMAEEEKQRLALDKLKLEKDNANQTFELQKLKQSFEMEKLVLTKDKEIEHIKLKAESDRLAEERKHDIEKFKLQQERDREKASKIHEISLLKVEGAQNEAMALTNLEMEKIKGKAELNAVKIKQELEAAEKLNLLKQEQLRHQQEIDQVRIEKEAEAVRQMHDAKLQIMNEQIKIQKEIANQNYLHQQELAKEQKKREEDNLRQFATQQRLEEEKRRNEELKRARDLEAEKNSKGLIRKIGSWLW